MTILDQLKKEDKERLLHHMEELKKRQSKNEQSINSQKEAEDDELTI